MRSRIDTHVIAFVIFEIITERQRDLRHLIATA